MQISYNFLISLPIMIVFKKQSPCLSLSMKPYLMMVHWCITLISQCNPLTGSVATHSMRNCCWLVTRNGTRQSFMFRFQRSSTSSRRISQTLWQLLLFVAVNIPVSLVPVQLKDIIDWMQFLNGFCLATSHYHDCLSGLIIIILRLRSMIKAIALKKRHSCCWLS